MSIIRNRHTPPGCARAQQSDPWYYHELDSIAVDIDTATTREHCQEIMERIKTVAKKRRDNLL